MTTNQSLTDAFKHTYKTGLKGLPILPALANFGVLAFFVTFFTGAEILSRQPIINDEGQTTGYISASNRYISFFFSDTDYMLIPALVLVAICGLSMAICTFNFITSKKQVNVYYSLGITRTRLFLGKYLAGATLLVVSTFIPLFITLIMNLGALGFSGTVFKTFFLYLFAFLLVGISAFTITSTIFACVGTVFEVGVFSAIILFLPDILLYGIQTVMAKFLYGNPYGFDFIPVNNDRWNDSYVATLSEQFSFLSPVFFIKKELSKFGVIEKETTKEGVKQVIESPDFTNIILWVILIAAIAFLGIKLFNKRKAEIAGFIGTNRILNTFVSFLAGFFAFALAISTINKTILAIVLGAIFFIIIHLGLELVVLRDLKKFVRGIYKLPVGLVAIAIFVVSISTGFFGFSERIPNKDKIKSVSVTLVGETSQYGLFGEGDSWYTDSNLQYIPALNALTGELTSLSDIDTAIKIHKVIASTEENNRTLSNHIQFSYTLKDGSTFKRNYENISPEAYKAVLYLEESEYFKNALNTLFKGDIKMPDPKNGLRLTSEEEALSNAQFALRDDDSIVSIYSKYVDSYFHGTLSVKDREKLLTALYNDLSKRSVTDKYYPDSCPIAFMKFEGDFYTEYWATLETNSDETTKENEIKKKPKTKFELCEFSSDQLDHYTSSFYNPQPFFVITPDMTETIELFKKLKIYDDIIKTPDFVSAKILKASECYNEIYKSEYDDVEKYFSRYFITAYTSSSFENVDEFGNPIEWNRYSETVDQKFNGYVTNDMKDVEKLLRYSYTAYEQDSTDSGYFVTFYTSTGDTSLCFIPENKLPSEFKIKF
jgi:hypothetical protein